MSNAQHIVTTLEIDARPAAAGADAYERAMKKLEAAATQAAEREARLQRAMSAGVPVLNQSSAAADKHARQWDRVRASADPVFAAHMKVQDAIAKSTEAVRRGNATYEEAVVTIEKVRRKHEQAAAANDNLRDAVVRSDHALDRFRQSIGLTDERLGRMQTGLSGAIATFGRYRLALAGIAGASIGGGFALSGVVETAASFQKLEASLKTVTGSATAAQAAMGLIQTFATETPFDLQQVTEAYIRLKSLGLDPTRESLQSYGNTASAMGKPIMQMIEAVADAVTGENERLKEFGIRASKEGEQIAFTFQGVTTTVANNAAEIEKYLRGLGEVQFAGAMLEQMKTLPGALSNLQDAVATFQNQIGQGGLSDAVEDSARAMSDLLSANEALARSLGSELGRGIRDLNQIVTDIASAASWAASEMKLFGSEVGVGFTAVSSVVNGFASTINGLFGSITGASSEAARILPNGWNDAVREIHTTIAEGVQRMVRTFAAIPAAGHAAREALFGGSFAEAFEAEQQRFVDAVNSAGSALGDALGFHVTLDEVVISTRDAANATADLRSNVESLVPVAATTAAAIDETTKANEKMQAAIRKVSEAAQDQIDHLKLEMSLIGQSEGAAEACANETADLATAMKEAKR